MNKKVKLTEDYVKNLLEKIPVEQRENYLIKCVVEAEEDKVELISEQHRLFDLAMEQETELNELKEFVRIVLSKGIDAPLINEYPNITYVDYNMKSRFELGNYTQIEFDLVKKILKGMM